MLKGKIKTKEERKTKHLQITIKTPPKKQHYFYFLFFFCHFSQFLVPLFFSFYFQQNVLQYSTINNPFLTHEHQNPRFLTLCIYHQSVSLNSNIQALITTQSERNFVDARGRISLHFRDIIEIVHRVLLGDG